jgi:hypothetical protein
LETVFLREEVAPKDFSLETWAQRIETDQRAAIGAQRGDYGAAAFGQKMHAGGIF